MALTEIPLFAFGPTAYGTVGDKPLDGSRPAGPLNKPVLPVTAFVNGRPALVVYAGNAPTLVEGAAQVNIVLPNPIYRVFPFDDPNTVYVDVKMGSREACHSPKDLETTSYPVVHCLH
jgi:hypothetical protein